MQILHLQMQVPQPYANFIIFWPSIEAKFQSKMDLETFFCPKNVTWWKNLNNLLGPLSDWSSEVVWFVWKFQVLKKFKMFNIVCT